SDLLGLGLAKIREGDLKPGRAEIEIATSLDPNNALIRSYLGKAYFEEKRDKQAMAEFAIAKELDSLDPTSYFYDAIRKQSVNRPVEALQDLQKSIELNDNRAVYRSRLLLDEDLAARSASLGRIYRDLGFQQRALVEGWESVNTAPSDYSGHRFLADTYSALPRHEIARVSELLQSQLLQPINVTPIQPRLAESDLLIVEGAGPADPAFNEFNPLFLRNRLALQASGVAGENDTRGGEVVQSGVWGRASYSVGAFRYKTDGFRENNDLDQELYNVFAQVSLTHKTSVQGEFRSRDIESGDLEILFDPNQFSPNLERELDTQTYRLGFHHAFKPNSKVIASIITQDIDESFRDTIDSMATIDDKLDTEGFSAELQHLFRSERFNIITGLGHVDGNLKRERLVDFALPFIPDTLTLEDIDSRHTNLYAYAQLKNPSKITVTGGLSYDEFDDGRTDRDQVNPKFGLTWGFTPATTLRLAIFRVLTRTLISDQTVEPTQVAGFNQFFDDVSGTDTWLYGGGLDHSLSASVYGGLQFSLRELDVPFRETPPPPAPPRIRRTDWEEWLGRVYLYWAAHPWLATSVEYRYENFDRSAEFPGTGLFTDLETQRVSLGGNFFHPSGFFARVKGTYVDQDGEFVDPSLPTPVDDEDQFWVFDASVGYRLPKRYGVLNIEVKNIFDEDFRFQDTDPANPSISPERLVLLRFTLSF
ncbi:MAG: TonB-dependent receptor, partial [Desulfobacterales bacterium]|nr:TonB-dependent receptor [Desulfobacterales bacterium]